MARRVSPGHGILDRPVDFNTFLSVVAAFALSIILWLATVKWLIARINVPKVIYERRNADGTYEYRIRVENNGHRDAVDVTVKCTLFSTGWGTDNKALIATIEVPVSTGQIDVMPGRPRFFKEDRKINEISRVVTLKFHDISKLQKDKLSQAQRRQLEAGRMRFEELAGFGDDSFLSVVVYANDRFSGARNVYGAEELTEADVQPHAL